MRWCCISCLGRLVPVTCLPAEESSMTQWQYGCTQDLGVLWCDSWLALNNTPYLVVTLQSADPTTDDRFSYVGTSSPLVACGHHSLHLHSDGHLQNQRACLYRRSTSVMTLTPPAA